MSGKHSGLFRLLAGLGVLLLVTVSLTAIPGLREIGRSSIEEATSRLQRGGDNIEVTSAQFSLPDYMWDIEVKDGETADIRPLVPSVATLVPSILKGSGVRIHVGEADGPYNLELQWDTGSSDTELELTLFDCLERPLSYTKGVSGNTNLILPSGLYKLALSSEGLLGEDFKLTAQATKTTEQPKFEVPIISGIPTIDIEMSGAMFQSWDVQRAALLEKLETQDMVGTVNFKRVLADLVINGERSTAQLWDAGLGESSHFGPDSPSFTGRIVSGPLLFGMSRFKLYTIRTQEGLLNHVVNSIMYDEGIFIPRWMMVHTTLNGRSLGLYLLVETPRSQGFFAGVQRYDGQVIGLGGIQADPPPLAGLSKQGPMSQQLEYSRELSSRVNRAAFAKTLAFTSLFHAAHGITIGDLRLYRHPYLDCPEPIIRDMNVGIGPPDERLLLVHTSWWLGPRLVGRAPHFNPKVFPTDTPIGPYTATQWTLPCAAPHPAAKYFVELPENREMLDQYLFYVCDQAFQRRFTARMKSAFEAALPFLDDGTTRPFQRLARGSLSFLQFDNEISWFKHQVDVSASDQFVVLRTIPALVKQSTLLVSVDPTGPAPTPGTRTVSLYNLSPFSARLRLPDYAHIADTSIATTPGDDASGWYLAPSLLFPTVVSLSSAESQQDLSPHSLTQEAAQRFLGLERLRLRPQPGNILPSAPFIDVVVPVDKFDDFISELETTSLVTLGSTYALSADSTILISELAAQEATTPEEEATHQLFWNFDETSFGTEGVALEESVLPRRAPGVRGSAVEFDGTTSFVSTNVDISQWRQLTLALWLKVDKEQTEDIVTLIDFTHDARSNCAIQLSPGASPDSLKLNWIGAGVAITRELPVNEWVHLVTTAEREEKRIRLFINGELVGEKHTGREPFGTGARLTIGRLGSSPSRYFHGAVDELLISSRPLSELKDFLGEQMPYAPKPSSPDVVILPLSLEPIAGGYRLSLLVSNFSDSEVSLDLSSLKWTGGPHPTGSTTYPSSRDLTFLIHAVWELGEKPSQVESSHITLGAASLRMDSSQSPLDSPMIWTGTLRGLLNGPADEAMPNCLLAEFDLVESNYRWMYTDANRLAQSASTGGVERRVVIHEPYEVYLPMKCPDIPKIPGYQSPPSSVTLSVSSFHTSILTSYTKDYVIDRDINTFWHVKHPPESSTHWVTFDFGEPITIEGLAILFREGSLDQLWDQDHAIFQGSNNPRNEAGWVDIAPLPVDKATLSLKTWDWLRYPLPNITAYRYYRILIDDPSFLSIAEVKFRAREWEQVVAPPTELTVAELVEQGVLEVDSSSSDSTKPIRLKNKATLISGVVTIPPGYVLELEPGNILKFTHNAGILSYSPIHAIGTAQEPIILSPAEGNIEWLGVAVVDASGTSEFQHVQMSQAVGGSMGEVQFSGGLTFMNTSVVIAETELLDFASEDGLHLHNASFNIKGLTIQNSKSDALDSDWSYGTIADSAFLQNGGDGIDLCGSWATITNCIMEGCADKGISIGEGSVANISGVHLIGNKTGIAVKDQSIVSLVDSEVTENEYGLLRYIKKPIYIYPELTLEKNQIKGNGTNIHEEAPTSWTRRFD